MGAALLIDSASWPHEKCVGLLRSTELFGNFQYAALRALLTASRLVALKQSRSLFTGADAALSAFVLVDGILSCTPGGGGDQPTYLSAPAVIGKTALVIDCLRSVTVTAETDAVLIEIPRATFLRVIAEYPEGAAHARRLLSGHMHKLIADLDVMRLRLDAIDLDDQTLEQDIQTLWPASLVQS
jgi:CRP-like cAMP-binding protein